MKHCCPFLFFAYPSVHYFIPLICSAFSLLKYWVNKLRVVVQSLSCVRLFVTQWTAAQQASLSFIISQSLLKFWPLSWWCHPTISSSVAAFFSCPRSFPEPGSFPVGWLFTSGGQSIGASASASALPMNIQDWFPLGLIGLISLLFKGLSRVF